MTVARTDAAQNFSGTNYFSGLVGFGSSLPNSNNLISIQGNGQLSGSTQYGLYSNPVSTSAATGFTVGVFGQATTSAASYAPAALVGVDVGSNVLGSGSSTANSIGVYINDQTVGTNNYGIDSLVSSGTSKYNIYAAGTADNKFVGHVYLNTGTTAPTIASGACGATTNGTVAGSDQAGLITIGAAATTSCAISFGSTWQVAPRACTYSPANTGAAAVTVLSYMSAIGTTGFTITGAVLASTNWYYHCF